MFTPIRVAIAVFAAVAFVMAVPSPSNADCRIKAEYARNIMTELFNPDDMAWGAVGQEYDFYSKQGPHWKRAVLNRALEKVDKLLQEPGFNPLDPQTRERGINNFRTTTYLACIAGVS